MNPIFTLTETADGSLTAFDARVGEAFKSRHAAQTESEKVFIEPGVSENPLRSFADPFRILELGLGLATNLRALVRETARNAGGPVYEYTGIDQDLLGLEFLANHDPELQAPWIAELVSQGETQPLPWLRARFLAGDFSDRLRALDRAGERFHAVFFDPFSPKANPAVWTEEYFRLAHRLLQPGGRLVTYSVSRVTKDGLRRAGFEFEKRALPEILNKREGLVATKPLGSA